MGTFCPVQFVLVDFCFAKLRSDFDCDAHRKFSYAKGRPNESCSVVKDGVVFCLIDSKEFFS